MSTRRTKQFFRLLMESGWREYLTLKIPYDLVGLNPSDYMKISDIEELLGCTWSGEEAGFVDHYDMDDNGVRLKMSFDSWFDPERPEFRDQWFYTHDSKYYTLTGSRGILNPDYDEDDPKSEYWMPDTFSRWCLHNDMDTESYSELFRKYVNSKLLLYDIHCGNPVFKWVSGHDNSGVKSELLQGLSSLTRWCKTIYIDHKESHFELCYAVRYSSDVGKFLGALSRVLELNKIKPQQLT